MKKNRLCFLHGKDSVPTLWGRVMKLIVVFMMISVGTSMAHGATENVYSNMKFDGQLLPQVKQKVLTGVVLGENRDTLPGVNVLIKGSTRGVITNVHGKFILPLPDNTDGLIICFSFIGKKAKEIKFTGQTELRVIMEDENMHLEEVIVQTGYQKIDKRHLTSAVTTLKMDDIMLPGVNTLDKMLEGHVPGMIFMQNSGQVGAAPRLRIRGTSTILGTQEPLWVLDGIPLTDPVNVSPDQINDLDFVNLLGNAISGLNPSDIEQIDVLKDASATALYGTRAANGVIVITTKQGKPGPPTVSYSLNGTYLRRSRYTDRAVNVMNALERIDYSREAVEKGLTYSNMSSWVGYEGALMDYYNNRISYQDFADKVSYYERSNTDWFDIICQDAFSHTHNLSIAGGAANMKYYASLGYSRENGMLRKEHVDRYTAMLSLNLNYERFSMSFRLSGNVQEKYYTPNEVGLMDYAYNTSRAVPAYNEDGSLWYYPRTFSGQNFAVNFNILEERKNTSQEMNMSGLSLSTQLGYKIFPSLRAEVTFSYTINNSDQDTYFGEKSAYATNLRGIKYDGAKAGDDLMPFGAELRKEHTKNTNYMLRGQLNYTKFLDEEQNHMITASVGGELSSTKYTGISQTHRGYLKDRGLLISTITPGSYPKFEDWLLSNQAARGVLKDQLTNMVSGYATVSYSYQNKYIFNANMRIDASNKFGSRANDKLLPVWSLSARWNIKEDIMQNWRWVSNLSWRASFGYQGNMLDTESPELIIKKGDRHTLMDSYRSSVSKFPNPNLSWEKTANFNTSVDFGLFKNRISGSFSYFYKKTKNAFLSKKISVINGVRQYTVNQGTVENTGVEFAFQLYPIPPGIGAAGGGKNGFTWRIDPQIGQVLNKLINKAISSNKGEQTLHDDYTYEDYLNGNAQVAGRPLNSFFSYEFTGLDGKNGIPTFARIGEENWEQYAEMTNDQVCLTVMDYSGCRVPYLQGGISNTFGYRQFALNFNLTYSFGSKVRLIKLYDNATSSVSAPQPVQNLRRELVKRWRKPGDEKYTNIPGIQTDADYAATIDGRWWRTESFKFGENIWQMYNYSDIRVVSGNYLKLQNISFRYTVPDSWCKKMHLSALYLSVSATNLFTLSAKELKGQDPISQSGSSTSISAPVRPTYTFNLNVSF